MTRYLLDTNVISEPARPRPNRDVLAQLERHAGAVAITAVVWHELWFGVERLQEGSRRDYLSSYLVDVVGGSIPILPYDAIAAQWHAAQRARLVAKGETPSFADGMIAAVAATRDMVLVTRNLRDFERFEGLVFEDWFSRATED